MFRLEINGVETDPSTMYFHAQDNPYPGGKEYSLFISEPNLVRFIEARFPSGTRHALSKDQASSLFGLISPVISLTFGRRNVDFFANTIETLEVREKEIRLHGVCSPRVSRKKS